MVENLLVQFEQVVASRRDLAAILVFERVEAMPQIARIRKIGMEAVGAVDVPGNDAVVAVRDHALE